MARKRKSSDKPKYHRKSVRIGYDDDFFRYKTPERQTTRISVRQPRPYRKPLPYAYHDTVLVSGDVSRTDQAEAYFSDALEPDFVSNKALSKIYEQLNQVESLRVAWIERQKAIDLVTSSVRTLIRIAAAVKRRDPKIVRAVLRRNPTAKDIIKTPSGLWLSYHFGWKPTVMDIHHAMGLFAESIPPLKVEGSSRGTVVIDTRPGIFDTYREGFFFEVDKIVKIGLKVAGINANVNLATSLGFGQPLSVAWELTTMSWIVDYVVNVGEFIKNFEPRFPGLTLTDEYTTTLLKGVVKRGYRVAWNRPWEADQVWNAFSMQRKLGLPNFELVFSSPADLKGQQLSYVVAVLLPMLIDIKKK